MADCPFDLFWYDKTGKTNLGVHITNENPWVFSKIDVSMPVAAGYSAAADYVVNDLPEKVGDAADEAQRVVSANASLSDEKKLEAYKDYICGAVSYNTGALAPGFAYGDPWQLISVFDGVPETEVVCEGYAKAFQYLCDLSTFSDETLEVYTVSGEMTGGTGAGPHMWNIVRRGGKSYLVDVTNSDAGTVGQDGELFMARADSGTVKDGYKVNGVTFTYGDDQKTLWGETVLKLAGPVAKITSASSTTGTYYADFAKALAAWTDGTTLTLLDNVSYVNRIDLEDGTRTFDGGEHTLTLTGELNNYGTLTIKGGTIGGDSLNGVYNFGTLTVKGGTINGSSYGVYNSGTATVEGCSINSQIHGVYTMGEGTTLISAGSISSDVYAVTARAGKTTITGDVNFSGAYKDLCVNSGTIDLHECTSAEGLTIASEAAAEVAIGYTADATVRLPEGYYVFVKTGAVEKIVNALASMQIGTIRSHGHKYTTTVDEVTNTITRACTCGIGTETAQLVAPEGDLVYNGMAYIPTVKLTNSTIDPVLFYEQNGQGVMEAKNAGNYTVTMLWNNNEVSMDFTILPADIAGATVTVEDFTYVGFAHTPDYTVFMNEKTLVESEDFTVTFPEDMVNAGDKELIFTGMGNYTGTKTATYTISKATPTVTAPEAVPELTYTGNAQRLVRFGRTDGGTLLYSLDGQEWSEAEPVGVEVGEYTVYYKVDGGTNYESVEAQSFTVSIGKGLSYLSAAPVPIDRTYDGTEQRLVHAGYADGGKLVYGLEENGTYTETIPTATNAGDYTVWYYVQGGDNYHGSEKASVQVKINPMELTVISNDAAYAKIYDGTTSIGTVEWKQTVSMEGNPLPGAAIQLTTEFLNLEYPSSDVGSYDAEIGVELLGDDAPNYRLNTDVLPVTAIIEPKPLTATAVDGARAYNATTDWTTSLELDGIIDGDEVRGWAEFTLPNVDEYTEATTKAVLELEGADAGNYTVAKEDVTFTQATIFKASADKWSVNVASPQNILVGSGLNAIIIPATGTGIGNEAVSVTGATFYTDAALQTPATDADISSLAKDASKTLYYKASSDNYEDCTGEVTVVAIDHEHVWQYSATGETITATCAGTIGTCPDAEQTISLVAPTNLIYDGTEKNVTVTGSIEGVVTPVVQYDGDRKNVTEEGFTAFITLGEATAILKVELAPKDITGATLGAFAPMIYNGEAQTPVAAVTMDGMTITGAWSTVTNVADKTTFTANGNFTGTIADQEPGMDKAMPATTDFIFAPPANPYYDGSDKDATVTTDMVGMGEISIVYYLAEGTAAIVVTPNQVGGYLAVVSVTEGDNYLAANELRDDAWTFEIMQSATSLTAEADKEAYTYGERITITGTAQAAGKAPVATFALRRAPAAQQVALFAADGTQLTEPADVVSGAYTLTYDTTGKDILPAESVTLTVKFMGDSSMADQAANVTVKLAAKSLTPALTGSVSKVYDGSNVVTDVSGVQISASGIITGDAVTVSAAEYTFEDANAGQAKKVTAAGMVLGGTDKAFYTLTSTETSAQIGEITKANLTTVTKPVDQSLTAYCADAAAAIAQLPAQVSYTTEDGNTVLLDVTWACADYDATPDATNTFTWTVAPAQLANCELAEGILATGTITVTNSNALPVTVTGKDASITYNGAAYDVKQLFSIDANAGAASYAIVSGGTGEGTLEGCSLTITKAGTITVKVTTAANGRYEAAEATAVLTVSKADPAVTVPAGLTAVCGQKLSEITLPAANDGTWAWAHAEALVGEIGVQVHQAIFTPENPDLWNTITRDVAVTVTKEVIVGDAPVITAPVTKQEVEVQEGEQGTMSVTAKEATGYQWYINRNDGKGYVAISGATSASYTTSKVKPDNDGYTYYCVVSNAYGKTESPVFLLQVIEQVEIPVTGDATNIMMWFALMLLSLAGLTAIMIAGRKGRITR